MKCKFLKNESGQAIILMALALVVLMVFAAVTIDVGMVAIQKGKLQNAIDAAALAAAQVLPDTSAATAAANQYVQLNGYLPADIAITFSDSNYRVKIAATRTVPYTFAQVLGITEAMVNDTASAKKEIVSTGFGYVLFSGSKTQRITFQGSGHKINGGVHTNNILNISEVITITGPAEAVSGITAKDAWTLNNSTIPNKVPNAPYIEMPTYPIPTPSTAPAGVIFKTQSQWGFNTWNSGEVVISEPIYCTGDFYLGSNANLKITGNGCILATGDITINNGSVKVIMDTGNPIGIRSTSGAVTISAVKISGAGCIVAKNDVKILQLLDGANSISTSNPIAVMSQNGSITIATPRLSGSGGLYAYQDVTFETDGGMLNVTGPIAVCAANGNLYLKNTTTITGVAYAPKGTISFSGGQCTVKGSLIADNFNLTNTIIGETSTGTGGGTTTKIHLVE